MKKMLLLLVLLPLLGAAGFAQESRQDFSLSVGGLIPPFIAQGSVQQTGTIGLTGLASYRFMLTPRNAVEVNYGYGQDAQKYFNTVNSLRAHTRMQEFSGAWVLNFNYKNFNPFLEGGPAGFRFTPLDDASTTSLDFKSTMELGAVYGGGIAYEISPSFDIRAEYRGQVTKTPNFGYAPVKIGRWYNISNPVVGIAYHF
ncbi:MAG TPA: outer membrane beta-barrel protein [Acidobacteriaceae bacterium]|jgi:opacity protein-like surface antigen|nr:outer membrane beta-barrel protein [Acidobacteriaceae bacterium]